MEHIKKIHNAIFVSDRIITYKAAAAILEINVNEAKKALEKYVDDLSNKDETLNVSYVIGGVSLTDQHKVRIVSQNKYEKAKSSFKTVTINHIYSIQKAPLVDWTPVFNVDDFLYDKNDTTAEVTVKQEIVDTTESKKEIKAPQPTNKKGGISNFLSNTNNQKKTTNQKSPKAAVKKEPENGNHDNKTKKQEKNTAFTNFFSKTGNKENLTKIIKPVKKEQVDSDDEEIFKVNKKRSRVLNDDEDEEVNRTKCPKVDILDDPMEEEEEFHSDVDIFGSPEKDEELMKDTEESTEKDTQISLPDLNTESTENNSETIENNSETTEYSTETSENNTEISETMYEDDDGYFVTEKKKPGSKSKNIKQKSKKETKDKKKAEKEEKKTKKEVVQKIKNNTNQKSILSFFQKK